MTRLPESSAYYFLAILLGVIGYAVWERIG